MRIATRARILVAAFLFLAAGLARAQAGPPMLADDPDTPGDGRWEINVAYTLEKNRSESEMELPLLDLNYGLGDRIQLKYELPWIVVNEAGSGTPNGFGNSLAVVKCRFRDEEDTSVNLSVYPQIEFSDPTGARWRGLVDAGPNLWLPLEVSRSFGALRVVGDVG